MKYWCDHCGAIIDEEDVAHWEEDRGEFWGQRCFERLSGCPNCFNGLEDYTGQDREGENEE